MDNRYVVLVAVTGSLCIYQIEEQNGGYFMIFKGWTYVLESDISAEPERVLYTVPKNIRIFTTKELEEWLWIPDM